MIFRNTSEDANRQAADWVARLHADDRSVQDETDFARWLSADPAHGHAFERASAIWDALGGLTRGARAQQPAREPVLVSRRAVLAGGAVLAAGGLATLGFDRAGASEYATAVGEQRRVTLADGSRVMLDTATRIRYRTGDDSRKLSLEAGRIHLEIAKDPRPFLIQTGARQAIARSDKDQARLDLRRDGEAIALTAIAGSVQVVDSGTERLVTTGERIAIAPGVAAAIDRPELRDLTAWQSGRLAFRDETLAAAAAEMNRYSDKQQIIVDPAVADLRLSGVYRVGDPEAFARSVALLLSVEIAADAAEVRLSRAR